MKSGEREIGFFPDLENLKTRMIMMGEYEINDYLVRIGNIDGIDTYEKIHTIFEMSFDFDWSDEDELGELY